MLIFYIFSSFNTLGKKPDYSVYKVARCTWFCGRVLGSRVQDSSKALHCVIEQDTLSSANY